MLELNMAVIQQFLILEEPEAVVKAVHLLINMVGVQKVVLLALAKVEEDNLLMFPLIVAVVAVATPEDMVVDNLAVAGEALVI